MLGIKNRFSYFFMSTKGLALVSIALTSLVVAVFGMLSGPMAEWGVSDIVIRISGMSIFPAEREGRIIILYHVIANAFIATEVYFITSIIKMRQEQRFIINTLVTIGYLTTMVFGLWFAYFGHNYIFHGVFLFGESIMFLAGIYLVVALYPWKREYYVTDKDYAHTKSGVDLERVAFFTMAVATLGSALFGAVAGSNFGNGFEVFLAEDVIRLPEKPPLMLSIIGHLHIMLTLIAVAAALIIGRWLDFKGTLHKLAMPLMILGTIIVTLGVWMVVPYEFYAHYIIYGGSTLILLAGLFLLIFNWDQLIKVRLVELRINKANLFQKLRALFHDPLKFGATWQMLFMNFTTSFVGIFFAVKLEEIIRIWPAREERIELSGHWHVLATITATILLLYFADQMGIKGKVRQWFGWLVIISSNIAFGATSVFYLKRLFISEADQQPLVDLLMLFIETGLGILLTVLAAFMIWRLADLFKAKGRWSLELKEENSDVPARR
ncbi:MAG: hypothetical protein PVF83_16815 [Anaerolineales bacterium]|jgi:hypothetical protein